MRFDTTKDVLVKGMQDVQNAINPKTTLPILSNILIETNKDNISLTATDLDIGITSNIQGLLPLKKYCLCLFQ